MSNKRGWRRRQYGGGIEKSKAAMARAADALEVGDAQEAERWTRVAEKFANAPRPAQTMEKTETIREELRARLQRYAEADLEEKKRQNECARAWEIAIWNDICANLGLAPLPFEPAPIDRDLLAMLYGEDGPTPKIY